MQIKQMCILTPGENGLAFDSSSSQDFFLMSSWGIFSFILFGHCLHGFQTGHVCCGPTLSVIVPGTPSQRWPDFRPWGVCVLLTSSQTRMENYILKNCYFGAIMHSRGPLLFPLPLTVCCGN